RAGLQLDRFPAIDGHALDVRRLIEHGIIKPSILKYYSAGHLGTAFSHLELWRKAINTGEVITVCEDDAILSSNFAQNAQEILSRLKPDWDVILFGWNLDASIVIEVINGLPGVLMCSGFWQELANEDFAGQSYAGQPIKLYQAFGIMCYSISLKGANALMEHALPLRDMEILIPRVGRDTGPPRIIPNAGIDIVMSAAYPRLQAFVSVPPLAISKNIREGSASAETVLASLRNCPG